MRDRSTMMYEARSSFGRSRCAALLFVLAGAVSTVVFVGGCTPWATYPEIQGSAGIHNPVLHPIPDIMGEALWYVHTMDFDDPNNRIGGGELIINLPPGTPQRVYDKVIQKLSGDARPMHSPSEIAYHVTEVRLRGTRAEVDVIHPSASGEPELVTLTMKQHVIHGFGTVDMRVWRYRETWPTPNYAADTQFASEYDDYNDARANTGTESGMISE